VTAALTLRPATIAADGLASSIARAHLGAGGKPVIGDTVVYSSTGDNAIGATSDLGNGYYSANVTASPDRAGKVTIVASDYSVWQKGRYPSAHATLNQAVPTMSIALKPATIPANGTSTSLVTIHLAAGGVPVTAGDVVTLSSSDPGQIIGPVTNVGKGTYHVTVTSSKTAGATILTATDRSAAAPVSKSVKLTQTVPKT
jgi:adhesin/invasin